MRKFKLGDRVRLVQRTSQNPDYPPHIFKECFHIGTVKQLCSDGDYFVVWDTRDSDGDNDWYYSEEHLEHEWTHKTKLGKLL
jgi:hypothetical protein